MVYIQAIYKGISIIISRFRYNYKSIIMEKNKHTFYHYINSACLTVGVIGIYYTLKLTIYNSD